MIHSSLILLAVASAAQPEPQTQLATLESLLTPLAAEAGYSLSITNQLAGRPLVYYFSTTQEPLERIEDIADQLDLQVLHSEESKLLTVSRSPKLRTKSYREQVQDALVAFQNRLRPYMHLTPAQMYTEGERLYALSTKNPYPDEAKAQSDTATLLRDASHTLGALSILPLMDGTPSTLASVLSKTASGKNRLAFPASADGLMQQFTSRQLSEPIDFLNKDKFTEARWENVVITSQIHREEMAQVPDSAILVLSHNLSQNGISIFLKAITPSTEIHLEARSLELGVNTEAEPPKQEPIEGWEKPFRSWLPFFGQSNGANVNALGMAAIPLGKNYVGWFGTSPFPQTNNKEIPLHEHLTRSLSRAMGVSGALEGDWLRLREYRSPWTEYQADWRVFEKIVPLVNEPASLDDWRKKLEPLLEDDFVELERVMEDFSSASPASEFWAVTGGSRLLRAALREMEATGQTKLRTPLGQLSALARNDAVAFFNGHWLRSYSPWVLHPQNIQKRDQSVLFAEIQQEGDKSILRYGLDFPTEHFTFQRSAQTEFNLPIKASP